MAVDEMAFVFNCDGESLVGILHQGSNRADCGVVIVVGGPQYRVGSHRQFVLMARAIAAAGVPVLRFDGRGMGDASGERHPFSAFETEINAAIGEMKQRLPQIQHVVLLGLCDGASASLICGPDREDVAGLVLINPWVRDDSQAARYPLRQYYLPRLRQRTLWRNLVAGKLRLFESVGGFLRAVVEAGRQRSRALSPARSPEVPFVARMRSGLISFQRPVLLLISGADLTGQEFLELCRSDRRWRNALEGAHVSTHVLEEADHTMSARHDLDEAVAECITWLRDEVGAT